MDKSAMRGDIKLIRGIGEIFATTNVRLFDEDEGIYENTEVDIYLGCLKGNWRVINTLDGEEIAKSCSQGMFTIDTNKTYKFAFSTRNISPLLTAAINGMSIKEGILGSDLPVITKTTFPVTSVAGAMDLTALDEIEALGVNIRKIMSIRRRSDGNYWFISDTADAVTRMLTSTDGVLDTGDATIEEVFDVTIQYIRDLEVGETVLIEDGTTFPNALDFTADWLIKVETGPDAGRKGLLTVVLRNCKREAGDVEFGGDAQAVNDVEVTYVQNFEGIGDTEFHYTWIDETTEVAP